MADEPGIELDVKDIIGSEPDAKVEAPEVPSTEETTEEVESKEETESKVEEKSDTEAEVEADTEDTKEETAPSKGEARNVQLNTEIRDLVAKRNGLKTEIEKINSEAYQPATEEELVEQGLSATDAKLESLNQRVELKDYNDRVAEAQLTIEHESSRVLQDFPMFNPDSEVFKNSPAVQAVAQQASDMLQANLIKDPNTGQVIGSNISPYTLYKTIADAYAASASENQIKGQKATEKMLSSVDSAPSGTVKTAEKDPFLVGLTQGSSSS